MRPAHYHDQYEPLKLIRLYNLNFELGNAVKYIARCDFKGEKEKDLVKAIHYLRLASEVKRPKKHKYDFVTHWTQIKLNAEAWHLSINLWKALDVICDGGKLSEAIEYIEKELLEGDAVLKFDAAAASPFEN